MTVSINEEYNDIIITVTGVIKGLTDSQRLKDAIESVSAKNKPIIINVMDSFAITSTIIGYLRKKIALDKQIISIKAKDERLYELFEELKLLEIFNVSKL